MRLISDCPSRYADLEHISRCALQNDSNLIMKCYLINLDRSADRLQAMSKRFANLGVTFTRVSGVDGRMLSQSEIDRFAGSSEMTPGTIGCLLSHRKCWQAIADGDEPFAAVFEDDMVLSSKSAPFLKSAGWIPGDTDILKIESFNRVTRIEKKGIDAGDGFQLVRLMDEHLGAGGYILSRQAAAKLLEWTDGMYAAIDRAIFRPSNGIFGRLTVYQITPALCIQSQFRMGNKVRSLIAHERSEKKARRTKMQKLRRELVRPIEKAVYALRRLSFNAFNDQKLIRIRFQK